MAVRANFIIDDIISIKNKSGEYKVISYTSESNYEVVLLGMNMTKITKLDINFLVMKIVKKGIRRRKMESSDSEFESLKGTTY